jgi:hypothetical protein
MARYFILTLLALSVLSSTAAGPNKPGPFAGIRSQQGKQASVKHVAAAKKESQAVKAKSASVVEKPKEGPVKSFYNWYLLQCTVNPYVAKSVTAAVVASLGDIMGQNIEAYSGEKAFSFNGVRTTSFFLCGLCYVGPFLHVWYEQLWKFGRWLEKKYGTSKTAQSLIALAIDQTVGVSMFFPSYFFVYEYLESLVLWRKPSFSRAHSKCIEQIAKIFWMQYRIFPLANGLNFLFVPEQLRVLASNGVSVFWNAFMCSLIA